MAVQGRYSTQYEDTAPGTGGVSDADILAYVTANINNPAAIAAAAQQYNVSAADLSRATGYGLDAVNSYFTQADITPYWTNTGGITSLVPTAAPTPTYVAPTPTYVAPTPTYVAPTPTYGAPAPAAETPAEAIARIGREQAEAKRIADANLAALQPPPAPQAQAPQAQAPTAAPTPAAISNAYFDANSDVAAAYAANTYGLTPEQFANFHWTNYGQFEGRISPNGTPAPTPTAVPLSTWYKAA